MKKQSWFQLVVFLLGVLILSACQTGEQATQSVAVPDAYAGKTNPHAGDAASADQGAALYTTNCVVCHGENGKGDTDTGQALDPKAADLTTGGEYGDDYLYWRLAEGGLSQPFSSSMPAWKNLLSEDEMWQLVTYLRSLQGS